VCLCHFLHVAINICINCTVTHLYLLFYYLSSCVVRACLCMQSAILLWQIRPVCRLSITLWCCIETNTNIVVKLFPPSRRGITLVFGRHLRNKILGNSLIGGIKYTGRGKCAILTEIPVYLRNGTSLDNGCYGSLIGSHRLPIDPCGFQ